MGLIGYWKFAVLLDVGCPWILLLPVHNLAYVGLLGNVARNEDGIRGGMDTSVWYPVLWLIFIITALACWRYPDIMLYTVLGVFTVLLDIVGMEIHYCLFKLYSRHPRLVSIIWWVPGVVLWQALVAEKRLEESV